MPAAASTSRPSASTRVASSLHQLLAGLVLVVPGERLDRIPQISQQFRVLPAHDLGPGDGQEAGRRQVDRHLLGDGVDPARDSSRCRASRDAGCPAYPPAPAPDAWPAASRRSRRPAGIGAARSARSRPRSGRRRRAALSAALHDPTGSAATSSSNASVCWVFVVRISTSSARSVSSGGEAATSSSIWWVPVGSRERQPVGPHHAGMLAAREQRSRQNLASAVDRRWFRRRLRLPESRIAPPKPALSTSGSFHFGTFRMCRLPPNCSTCQAAPWSSPAPAAAVSEPPSAACSPPPAPWWSGSTTAPKPSTNSARRRAASTIARTRRSSATARPGGRRTRDRGGG